MNVSRNSILYKIAYSFSEYTPRETNLCRFFWRVIGMSILIPILTIIVLFVSAVIYFLCFFVASKPDWDIYGGDSIPYKRWPEIHGHRVWPITVISILCLIYAMIVYAPIGVAKVWDSIDFYGLIFFGIVAFVLAIIGATRFARSELGGITKEYIVAKKRKICPLIKFV